MEVVLCTYGIEWHGPQTTLLQHLANRSGTLAVVNLIPLVILAGRNSPLVRLLDISYATFNLMHRWFGRIVIALAVTHGISEIVQIIVGTRMHEKVKTSGLVIFSDTLKEARFIVFGLVVSLLDISYQDPSINRA